MKTEKEIWEAISTKKEEEHISFHINKIAKICSNNISNINDIGLYTGLSGMVLFLSYYSKHYKSKTYEESTHEALTKIINLLNSAEQAPSYCSGIAGVGWMMMHLKEKGYISVETDDFFEDIDEYLYLALINDLKKDNYDFLHGYLGILYYFLERLKSDLSQKNKDLIAKAVQAAFTKINEKALICDVGIKWESKASSASNVVGYNLGLAHGIPSIINVLGKFPSNLNPKNTQELIFSGINYLKSTKLDSSNSSLYSNFIKKDGANSGVSRMGWCYGDLGIGLTFFNAGRSFNSYNLENEALDIFNHAMTRTKMEDNGVRDACFCHGTTGISHIFNSVYQRTRLTQYKEIAIYWNQETMKLLDDPNGYKTWFNGLGWQKEYSLLEGVSGIGLSLLASISDETPEWDKCFLVR
jgi:lantibiotic modifying enzyme